MNLLTPPSWLDRYGKAYWQRIAPALDTLGKLDAISYDLLATGCQSYSTYRQAIDTLKAEGRISAGKVHPACRLEKQAFEQLCRVFKELQLGNKPAAQPTDELNEFLSANQNQV